MATKSRFPGVEYRRYEEDGKVRHELTDTDGSKKVFDEIRFIDWGRKAESSAWCADSVDPQVGFPDPTPNTLYVCENVPNEQARLLTEPTNTHIVKCNTKEVRDLLKKLQEAVDESDPVLTKLGKHISDKNQHKRDSVVIRRLFQTKPEKFRSYCYDVPLTALYNLFKSMQEERMTFNQRTLYNDSDATVEILKGRMKLEEKAMAECEKELMNYPVYTGWLSKIKGCGVAISAGLIGNIKDISRFNHVSALWKYAGLDVRNGKAPRKMKGQVADWKHELRSILCGIAASCFIKARTPVYRDIYDEEKARWLAAEAEKPGTLDPEHFGSTDPNHPHQPLNHAHKRAIRKMMKVFLAHLWFAWRKSEGLPTPDIWAIAHGGHVDYIQPPVPFDGIFDGMYDGDENDAELD